MAAAALATQAPRLRNRLQALYNNAQQSTPQQFQLHSRRWRLPLPFFRWMQCSLLVVLYVNYFRASLHFPATAHKPTPFHRLINIILFFFFSLLLGIFFPGHNCFKMSFLMSIIGNYNCNSFYTKYLVDCTQFIFIFESQRATQPTAKPELPFSQLLGDDVSHHSMSIQLTTKLRGANPLVLLMKKRSSVLFEMW